MWHALRDDDNERQKGGKMTVNAALTGYPTGAPTRCKEMGLADDHEPHKCYVINSVLGNKYAG